MNDNYDSVFESMFLTPAKAVAEGMRNSTPQQRDENWTQAVSSDKAMIELDDMGKASFANVRYAPTELQAYATVTQANGRAIDKQGLERCFRSIANHINTSEEYSSLSQAEKRKLFNERCKVYGLAQSYFADSDDPDTALDAWQSSIFAKSANNSHSYMKAAAEDAVKKSAEMDAFANAWQNRAGERDDFIIDMAAERDDAGEIVYEETKDGEKAPVLNVGKQKYAEELWDKRNDAIMEELVIRAQDAAQAYRENNPDCSDAELYGIFRKSAMDNLDEVKTIVDSGGNYMFEFEKIRHDDDMARAARYRKEYEDSMKDLAPLKQAGDALSRVVSTQEVIRETERQELLAEAKKDLKGQPASKEDKPLVEMAPYTANVCITKQNSDVEPTLFVPEAVYAKMLKDYNVQEGEGISVHFGSGKNMKYVPVAPAKVNAISMNRALAKAQYIDGKRTAPTADQMQAYANGYRYTLYFQKTQKVNKNKSKKRKRK